MCLCDYYINYTSIDKGRDHLCIIEKKKGKFILLHRFNRKKIVITKKLDNEIKIDAIKQKYHDRSIDVEEYETQHIGWQHGHYKVENDKTGIFKYALHYPFDFSTIY